MKYYVIDIGTNSVRLMRAHVSNGCIICEKKQLLSVRTGEGVNASKVLCEAAIARTIGAISEYKSIAADENPDAPIYCFATSAVRDAKNREEFVQAVFKSCEIDVEILSGDAEARCGFVGAVPSGTGVVLDIGGGSTEIVMGKNGKIEYAQSFDVGCVRALELFGENAFLEVKKWAMDAIKSAKVPSDLEVFAIGGTATALAAIKLGLVEYDPNIVHGYLLDSQSLLYLENILVGISLEKRKQITGLSPKRADVIVHGLAIMSAFMSSFNISAVTVSEADNMEGYLSMKLEQLA